MPGYAAGDILRVGVENGQVVYRKNGVLLYQSKSGPVAYPLQMQADLFNGGLNGAMFAGANAPRPVTWGASAGATVTGNNLTENNATCPAWGAGAAASSQEIVSGDGYVELTASETNTTRLVGMGQVGTWSPSRTGSAASGQIDYAISLSSGGGLGIYESGASVATPGSYVPGDVLRVAIEGGKVVYRKNGALLYSSTSSRPAYPLQAEAELYDCGATVKSVVFSGAMASPVDWTGVYGTVARSFTSLKKTGAAGWDSGAASRQMLISADGCAYGFQRCFVQATAPGYAARAIGLHHASNAQSPNLDFGLYARVDGSLAVQEGGVDHGAVGFYVAGDVLAVSVINGTVLYTAATARTSTPAR